jgi:hypothetical protein
VTEEAPDGSAHVHARLFGLGACLLEETNPSHGVEHACAVLWLYMCRITLEHVSAHGFVGNLLLHALCEVDNYVKICCLVTMC